MLQMPNCPVIAIEEHYYDHELVKHFGPVEPNSAVVDRMYEFGERRLKEMDEAGIDIQVISHGAPSMQNVKGDVAVEMGRRVNDRLAAIVAQIVEAADPWWAGWGSLALAGSGFVPTLTRTVPNARRLGSAKEPPDMQSTLARSVCRDHLFSFVRMSLVLGLQLSAV